MRKIVLIMILAFAVVGAADDCKIFAVGKIICKNSEYGITAIYKKQKGNQWIAKAYAEERVKRQTEAVVVKKFFNVNLFETCLEGFKRFAKNESRELSVLQMAVSCQENVDRFEESLKTGKNMDFPIFEYALQESVDISIMYCIKPTYVRTFRYNKDTGLETDRRDYRNLKPGTYCQDFLATDDLYWKN